MEESNDNIKKTILVAEDVESNFLLLKDLQPFTRLQWFRSGRNVR